MKVRIDDRRGTTVRIPSDLASRLPDNAGTPASLRLNGRHVDETVVSGDASLGGTLEGGWNALVLEAPLIEGNPPEGLRLKRIAVSGLR